MTAIEVSQSDELGTTLVHRGPTSPERIVDLVQLAIAEKVPVEVLERLDALHERVSARQAARDFADALTRFQGICPVIKTNRMARYANSDGTETRYRYADLDHIAKSIQKQLVDCGLAYTFDSAPGGDGMLIVKCVLRHRNGHEQVANFPIPTTTNAKMSPQQKSGAALTYARRQALVQVLGLTTTESDTDAAEAGDTTPITPEQLQDLRALMEECKVTEKRVLKTAKVDALERIPAAIFERLCKAIREAAEQRQAEGAK